MIKDFTDLRVWQSSKEVCLFVYKVTESFPKEEIFGLSQQIRRASVSISSNIAEGFGRTSKKDQEHFYIMASGSLYEVKSQIIIANELGYITDKQLDDFFILANLAHKQLNALIKIHKSNLQSQMSNV